MYFLILNSLYYCKTENKIQGEKTTKMKTPASTKKVAGNIKTIIIKKSIIE